MLERIMLQSLSPTELSNIFKSRKSSTFSWGELVYGILILLGIAIGIYLGVKLYKRYLRYMKKKRDYSDFLRYCEEKNLTYHQMKILETLSKKYDVIPSLLLRSRKELVRVSLLESKSLLAKYPANHPVYVDFDSNMKYIKTVFAKIKPADGELINSSQDVHVGTPVIVYKRDKQDKHPVKGVIIYMDANKFVVRVQGHLNSISPLLHDQENLNIFFNHNADANYEFVSRLTTHKIVEKPEIPGQNSEVEVLMAFTHSATLKRRQRRKFIRVRVDLPVVINKEILEGKTVPVLIQGKIIDISNGGCSIESPTHIVGNVIVSMTFYLGEKPIENVLGKIIRSQSANETFIHHLSFIQLADEVDAYLKHFVSQNIKRRV